MGLRILAIPTILLEVILCTLSSANLAAIRFLELILMEKWNADKKLITMKKLTA